MKRIFSIEITGEDGTEILDATVKGFAWKMVVFELDQWLRDMAKYEEVDTVKVEAVREKIIKLMAEENLALY